MKFEYRLEYDFVIEKLFFRITKMEESLRSKDHIVQIGDYHFYSCHFPEISTCANRVYLCGASTLRDNDSVTIPCTMERASKIAKALKEFQLWVEENCGKPVEMTIAQIEEKLGIKNLKVIKEDK